MTYYQTNKYNKPFTPKKPVRSFRDLDVYQNSMSCAVIIAKDMKSKLLINIMQKDFDKWNEIKKETNKQVLPEEFFCFDKKNRANFRTGL